MTTITIGLDNRTAELYEQTSEDVREKLQLLLNLWLRDFVSSPRSLQSIMDEVSNNAQARGLTPEILESLLHEA